MMQGMDPISCGYLVDQLALCCGVGNRKRGRGAGAGDFNRPQARNTFFYSPSHVDHLNHQRESSWALAGSHYATPASHQTASQQPYLLLTQPVIITTTTNHPNQQHHNHMTLVQHAQTAPNHSAGAPPPTTFPFYSIISSPSVPQTQPHFIQPNIVSSQYAIYNMQAAATSGGFQQQTPMATIQEQSTAIGPLLNSNYTNANSTNQNIYYNPKALLAPVPLSAPTIANAVPPPPPTSLPVGRNQQGAERKVATLSSEVFRQLELIEKQVDLSADLETVEKYGIVITRALDPYSLMPHLTESILREYNNQYLLNESFVVRFVEIIKRPGQTLGLYIRTIRFEDHTQEGQDFRTGVVITKIDTDSPIYNSPILHVGDEILSVNLVDVSGMSLDNVVVIMSIPRRLVLALRIPRDKPSTMDFMQQHLNQNQHQHQLQEQIISRNPLDQHQQQQQQQQQQQHQEEVMERVAAGSFVDMNQPPRAQSASFKDQYYHQHHSQQHQIGGPQKTLDDNQLIPSSSSSDIKQPSIISNIRLGDTPEQSSYFSSSIDAINRELKELRRQRMALSNNEQSLDSTRVDF